MIALVYILVFLLNGNLKCIENIRKEKKYYFSIVGKQKMEMGPD